MPETKTNKDNDIDDEKIWSKSKEKEKIIEKEKCEEESKEDDEEAEMEKKLAAMKAKKEAAKKEEKEESKKAKVTKCPHDHKFGIDIDEHKECEDCSEWKLCAKEQVKLESGK